MLILQVTSYVPYIYFTALQVDPWLRHRHDSLGISVVKIKDLNGIYGLHKSNLLRHHPIYKGTQRVLTFNLDPNQIKNHTLTLQGRSMYLNREPCQLKIKKILTESSMLEKVKVLMTIYN